jgi:hypothetical protein
MFFESLVFCMVVLSVSIHATKTCLRGLSKVLAGLVRSFGLLTCRWLTDWMRGQDIVCHQQYLLAVYIIPPHSSSYRLVSFVQVFVVNDVEVWLCKVLFAKLISYKQIIIPKLIYKMKSSEFSRHMLWTKLTHYILVTQTWWEEHLTHLSESG